MTPPYHTAGIANVKQARDTDKHGLCTRFLGVRLFYRCSELCSDGGDCGVVLAYECFVQDSCDSSIRDICDEKLPASEA